MYNKWMSKCHNRQHCYFTPPTPLRPLPWVLDCSQLRLLYVGHFTFSPCVHMGPDTLLPPRPKKKDSK